MALLVADKLLPSIVYKHHGYRLNETQTNTAHRVETPWYRRRTAPFAATSCVTVAGMARLWAKHEPGGDFGTM